MNRNQEEDIENRIQSIVLDLDRKIKDQEGQPIRYDHRQIGVFKNIYIGFEMIESRVARFKFHKSAMNISHLDVVFCSIEDGCQYRGVNQDTLFIMIANDMTDFEDIQWKNPVFNQGAFQEFIDTDQNFSFGLLKHERINKTLEKFINPVFDAGTNTNHILYVENEECFVSLTKGFKVFKNCYVKVDVFAQYQPEIDFSIHFESGKQGYFNTFGFKSFYNEYQHRKAKMIHHEACGYIINKESMPVDSRCYSKQEHPTKDEDFVPKPQFPFIKRCVKTNKGKIIYKSTNPCFVPVSNLVQHCDFGESWRSVLAEKNSMAKKDNIPLGYNKVRIFSLTKGSYKNNSFYIVKFHSTDSGFNPKTNSIEPLTESHILWCSEKAYWKIEQLINAAKVDDINAVLGKSIILIKMDNPKYKEESNNRTSRLPDKYIYEYTSVEGRFIEEYRAKDQEEIDQISFLPDIKELCLTMSTDPLYFK